MKAEAQGVKNSDKRDEIIRAALELIAGHGFHGAPMAMVAEKAGVGAGTIYRYFDSKDALIAELYREVEGKIITALKEGYSEEKPLRERFLHLGTALLRYFIAHPLYFLYTEQYHNSPYGVSLRRDRMMSKSGDPDMFGDLFEQGISQQVLKDFPIPVLFPVAFGPMILLMRDHILGHIVLDDGLIRQLVEACWDGIKR
jgi:AcrR family transcriptional regulator